MFLPCIDHKGRRKRKYFRLVRENRGMRHSYRHLNVLRLPRKKRKEKKRKEKKRKEKKNKKEKKKIEKKNKKKIEIFINNQTNLLIAIKNMTPKWSIYM